MRLKAYIGWLAHEPILPSRKRKSFTLEYKQIPEEGRRNFLGFYYPGCKQMTLGETSLKSYSLYIIFHIQDLFFIQSILSSSLLVFILR